MLALAEPIRIVTKSHALGIAGAAFLLGVLHHEDKRCSVHVVQQYTRAELDALRHEDYPIFVLIDCVEEEYRTLKNSIFISSQDIYGQFPSSSLQKYAYILVAGYYAEHLESGSTLSVPDNVLQGALQSGMVVTEQFAEVNPLFFERLLCNNGILKKLVDFSAIINACARTGKAVCAISALLNDIHAQEEAIRVLAEYRHEITNALEWCKTHTNITKGVSIIHMKDYVAWYLTGSVAQHFLQEAGKPALILVLAYAPDDWVRVSLRGNKDHVHLLTLLQRIFDGVGGECGGNEHAAGGVFPRAHEEKFLGTANQVLEHAFAEEDV